MGKKKKYDKSYPCRFGSYGYNAATAAATLGCDISCSSSPAKDELFTRSRLDALLEYDPGADQDGSSEQQTFIDTAELRVATVVDVNSYSCDGKRVHITLRAPEANGQSDGLRHLSGRTGKISVSRIGDAVENRGRPKKSGNEDDDGEDED